MPVPIPAPYVRPLFAVEADLVVGVAVACSVTVDAGSVTFEAGTVAVDAGSVTVDNPGDVVPTNVAVVSVPRVPFGNVMEKASTLATGIWRPPPVSQHVVF